MNTKLTDMIHELAYRAVQDSPLFDSLETNGAVDSKADELADQIKELVKTWIEQECGSSVLPEGSELRSLTEAAA